MATTLAVAGIGLYVLIWWDPSVAPYPSGPGEWRGAPLWLRRVVRRGGGPFITSAVAVQGAALSTFVYGILYSGPTRPLSGLGGVVLVTPWVVALVIWCLIAVRARRKRPG